MLSTARHTMKLLVGLATADAFTQTGAGRSARIRDEHAHLPVAVSSELALIAAPCNG